LLPCVALSHGLIVCTIISWHEPREPLMTTQFHTPSSNFSPHHPPSPPEGAPSPSPLTVELFGVPRLLAGARSLTVTGATLGDLAADLMQHSPALAGRVLDEVTGWPLDGYSFVVDEQFTRDRSLPLPPGTSVLLVASAAGG
jgi:molybdopterin converting factor small subunit